MNARQRGFTLLEIMIALAVFAVVSAALVRNAAVAIRQTGMVEERALGTWLAENQLNAMRLRPRTQDNYPAAGTQRYPVTLGERDWELLVEVEATANEDVRRVVVKVYSAAEPDQEQISLTGFLGRY
jgi:general secretion pathway protein I